MACITLKDGTYIYDGETCARYLERLGFDVSELYEVLGQTDVCGNLQERVSVLEAVSHDHEMAADGYHNDLINMYNAIDEIATDLIAGKPVATKVKIGRRLKSIIESTEML